MAGLACCNGLFAIYNRKQINRPIAWSLLNWLSLKSTESLLTTVFLPFALAEGFSCAAGRLSRCGPIFLIPSPTAVLIPAVVRVPGVGNWLLALSLGPLGSWHPLVRFLHVWWSALLCIRFVIHIWVWIFALWAFSGGCIPSICPALDFALQSLLCAILPLNQILKEASVALALRWNAQLPNVKPAHLLRIGLHGAEISI
jgi:hypothetical protein